MRENWELPSEREPPSERAITSWDLNLSHQPSEREPRVEQGTWGAPWMNRARVREIENQVSLHELTKLEWEPKEPEVWTCTFSNLSKLREPRMWFVVLNLRECCVVVFVWFAILNLFFNLESRECCVVVFVKIFCLWMSTLHFLVLGLIIYCH